MTNADSVPGDATPSAVAVESIIDPGVGGGEAGLEAFRMSPPAVATAGRTARVPGIGVRPSACWLC
jgi:hypothetical protein